MVCIEIRLRVALASGVGLSSLEVADKLYETFFLRSLLISLGRIGEARRLMVGKLNEKTITRSQILQLLVTINTVDEIQLETLTDSMAVYWSLK